MCFLAREPWIKLLVYTLAQTLGAFLGAGIIFGLYYGKTSHSAFLYQPPSFAWDPLAPGFLMIDSRACPGPRLMTHSPSHKPKAEGTREDGVGQWESQALHPPHPLYCCAS